MLGTAAGRPTAAALARTAIASLEGCGKTATTSIDPFLPRETVAATSKPMPQVRRPRQLRRRPSLRVMINKRNITQQQQQREQRQHALEPSDE